MDFPKRLIKNTFLIGFLCLCMTMLNAQRADGDVGIGIQFGQPSGLSLQVYKAGGPSLDLLAAWDLKRFLYLNGHALFQPHIGNSDVLHFIYGPGVFVGLINDNEITNAVDLGISGTAGLSLLFDKVEIYGRVTPRLALLNKTKADIGGGAGVRFYF